jgi:hypothetical protein
MVDTVREWIEWIARESGTAAALAFPMLLLGLAGLYVLWLVVGYLRASQVGLADQAVPGGPSGELSRAPDGVLEAPAGYPYCPEEGLRYEPGVVFCVRCERDLALDCANCRTTIRAADGSCFRCGTRDIFAAESAH